MSLSPRSSGDVPRCPWANTNDPLMIAYHDDEWGVPCHDDDALFERLCLEIFQAGLSWRTILHKRQHFWRAFEGWQPERVAQYGEPEIVRLLNDAGIVRNRRKIEAAIQNARAFGRVQQAHGTFAAYLWAWVNGKPLRHPEGYTATTLPARTPLSDTLTKDLKRRGFLFIGSTVCYAFMQSVGMVDDHVLGCFKFGESGERRETRSEQC
jgi:DNA-3-methyladenine glycosylase I